MQTAVLNFYKDLEKYALIKDSQFILNIPLELLREIFDKSEILHKHQIIDAYYEIGRSHPDNVFIITKSAEEYYTSTYGSKGSDVPFSQTEISDEEIEKVSNTLGDDYYASELIMWEKGAKWYREQLKQL